MKQINLREKLIDKSIEAFIMGLEIYNKPSIKYRVEGFSFFICNAWELMLKARLIDTKGESSIYYKDKRNRTLSLENCIKKVFTNNKDPLRLNLENIIVLRNTSTHFVCEEYEKLYVPLFQACVFNYGNKLSDFFGVDITDSIAQGFLNLSVDITPLAENEIKAKYPTEISDKLMQQLKSIEKVSSANGSKFALAIRHDHYITKQEKKASHTVRIAKNSEEPILIIKDLKDPNETHKLTATNCLEHINRRIKSRKIPFSYTASNPKNNNKINIHLFSLIVKFYNLKTDPKYTYTYQYGKTPQTKYSMKIVDFIIEEIEKNPNNLINDIKTSIKKR